MEQKGIIWHVKGTAIEVLGFLKQHRRLVLQVFDLCLWLFGAGIAMYLVKADRLWLAQTFVVVAAAHVLAYNFMGMYQVIWRYAGIRQFSRCIECEALVYVLLDLLGGLFFDLRMNRFCTVALVCTALLVVTSRLGYAAIISWRRGGVRPVAQHGTRTLIIGAGEAARILLGDMQRDESGTYAPVGLVDDDKAKVGRRVWNVKVYGTIDDLSRLVNQLDVQLIVFAIFDITEERKRSIMEKCAATGVKVMIAPSPRELHEVGTNVSQRLREVDINDLLGRDPIKLENVEDLHYIQGQTVMVTGGGGSIGSELCRQIAAQKPKKLIMLDIYENSAYDVQQELIRKYGDKLDLSVEILSICDRVQMDKVFNKYRPDVLFHAAAHKHVPLMENAPIEAIKNNVFGTLNTAQMADKYGVKRFVMISTDKAVNPTNVMGATKRCCELVVQAMNKRSKTEFVAVRFGNVLGSNGSVIPLFKRQIAEGGPITVTHPNIIRYFMTIPEATQLVLTAGNIAAGGEIFVLDMGQPVKILDLANNMIRLMGLVPDKDIKIEFTGLRPGEKLFEELLLSEEGTGSTDHEKIFVAAPLDIDEKQFWQDLERLRIAVNWGRREHALLGLRALVPTWHNPSEQSGLNGLTVRSALSEEVDEDIDEMIMDELTREESLAGIAPVKA
jgi:FlaA1/EpsC-like NDP-sugar epimerase